MIGAPGSSLWLLGHEFRLAGRRMFQGRRGRRGARAALGVGFLLFVPVLCGAVTVPVGFALRGVAIPVVNLSTLIALLATVAIFTLMLSQTLAAAVDALYERNDLDLLFSSPLEPRRVMTVRFLGVALSVFGFFGYFLGAPLLVLAVMGHPAWLGALGVLAAIALGATGVGLLVSAGLFRVLGPRRTRTVAQVLAAVIGAAFFIASQARNILGGRGSSTMMQSIGARALEWRLPLGADWPLRAMLGQPAPLITALVLGAGLFWGATAWLGPRFARDAAAAAGAGASSPRRAGKFGAFASGPFAATLRKEWRLLARDPALLTQVLLRVLYLLPLGFVLLRRAGEHDSLLLPGAAAALTLMASQVAGSLAWITMSAEDAPDLLACAPAEIRDVRRGKMAAAAAPVGLLLAPILVPLTVLEPLAGVAAIAGCAASVISAVLLHLWWQRPAKRSEFRRRRSASWFVGVTELLVGFLLAGATGLAASGSIFFLAPAVVAAGVLFLLRRSDRQIAEQLRAAASAG